METVKTWPYDLNSWRPYRALSPVFGKCPDPVYATKPPPRLSMAAGAAWTREPLNWATRKGSLCAQLGITRQGTGGEGRQRSQLKRAVPASQLHCWNQHNRTPATTDNDWGKGVAVAQPPGCQKKLHKRDTEQYKKQATQGSTNASVTKQTRQESHKCMISLKGNNI